MKVATHLRPLLYKAHLLLPPPLLSLLLLIPKWLSMHLPQLLSLQLLILPVAILCKVILHKIFTRKPCWLSYTLSWSISSRRVSTTTTWCLSFCPLSPSVDLPELSNTKILNIYIYINILDYSSLCCIVLCSSYFLWHWAGLFYLSTIIIIN